MDKRRRLSRRAVTKQIGVAAGITLLGPGVARAASVTPAQVEGPFHPIDEQADTDLDLLPVLLLLIADRAEAQPLVEWLARIGYESLFYLDMKQRLGAT